VDEFWASAKKRGIELVVRTPLPAAYVRGDQTLLMRALCNLIDNAIKYSPAGTRIECGIDAAPGYWRASVRDHGQGIAPQDLARLFEPFSRVGVDTKTDVGGAGLGLAFVRTVAQRHGGEVEVTSELGAGSIFTLRLPMAPEEGRTS
jgi:signal transduction histidine kinase